MPALDWIFLAVLLASLALGFWRGLVYEVLSAASWVAAFLLAQWLGPALAVKLPMSGAAEPVRVAAAFVIVFVASVFVGSLLAVLARKLLSLLGLAPADRTLGALFGLTRGLVILLSVALVVSLTPLKNASWWEESTGARMSTAVLKGLRPVLPEKFGSYLPS
jgi:membrane protein required for colicin V production